MKLEDISELSLFDHYDPYTEELPERLRWQLNPIVDRCLFILKKRNLEQLKHALHKLRRWRIFANSKGLQCLSDEYGSDQEFSFSEVQLMFACRSEIDLTQTNEDQFTKAELMATLSLGKIALLIGGTETTESEYFFQSTLIESVEACGFAQSFWLDEERMRKVSQAQKAHKQRTYAPLKRWTIQNYLNLEPGLSNRKAAQLLFEQMPKEIAEGFLTSDIPKGLAVWIGQYKKGELSDVDDLPSYQDG